MIREIKAIIRPDRLDEVIRALRLIPGLPGVTVSTVSGFGRAHLEEAGVAHDTGRAEFAKLETVVPAHMVDEVTRVIRLGAGTGRASDGKIFVLPVETVTRISSGEEGEDAI